MATATGKTVVGLSAAYHLFSQKGSLSVLVICHSKAILNQWRQEVIEKLGFIETDDKDYTDSVSFKDQFVFRFETIQKVMKNPVGYKSDLLIVDEVHHGAGARFREALSVPCNYKLGLSATIEGQERYKVLEDSLGKSVFTYSLKDARNDGIIPEFRLVIHKTFLDISEEKEFDLITDKITRLLNYINASQRLEIKKLSKKRFDRFESVGDFVRLMKNIRSQSYDIPKEWDHLIGLINKRRWVIHRSSPKIDHAIDCTEKLAAEHKCVLFAMDIATCEHINKSLSKSVPSFLIHSGLNELERKNQLAEFKKSRNGVLIAPKILDEGIDLPDVDIGINVAASKTELQLIQRLGRILRNRPGKEPVFHHFVAAPRNYIISEDSFTYQNDLGWINDMAMKMGIPIDEIIDEQEEFTVFEQKAENAVSQYFKGHESLKTEDNRDIRVQNLVDTILPNVQEKMIEILGQNNGKITDKKWVKILRDAYRHEKMLEIPSHRWLLVIGDREPERIRQLILKHQTLTDDIKSAPKDAISNLQPKVRAVSGSSSVKTLSCKKIPANNSSNISLFISKLRESSSQGEIDRASSALLKKGEAAVEPLIGLLDSGDKEVCLRAILLLEKIKDRRAVEPLIKCLRNSSPAVRIKAVHALGELGDKSAKIYLMRLHDPNPKVKRAVKNALGKLNG